MIQITADFISTCFFHRPAWHQNLNAIEPWVPVHGGTKAKVLRVSEDNK